MHDLTAKSYQHARVHCLRQEVEDVNCQSHKFFHDLHESHARHNMVSMIMLKRIDSMYFLMEWKIMYHIMWHNH